MRSRIIETTEPALYIGTLQPFQARNEPSLSSPAPMVVRTANLRFNSFMPIFLSATEYIPSRTIIHPGWVSSSSSSSSSLGDPELDSLNKTNPFCDFPLASRFSLLNKTIVNAVL